MVPLYSGVLCFLARDAGLVQSLLPSARPMKFATVIGALSGNNSQVMVPLLVSRIALGLALGAAFGAGACAHSSEVVSSTTRNANSLRIITSAVFINSEL